MVPAPENIKTDHPAPPRLGMEPHDFPACPEMVWANTVSILTYTLAIPRKMHTRKLYMNLSRLPFLFCVLIKGYIASLRRVKEKDTSFQSTPHDITIKNKENNG